MSLAYQTFHADKIRFTLTALGFAIGTSALIIVTTIGVAGKQYVLSEIESVGSNFIYAEHDTGGGPSPAGDALSISDMQAAKDHVKNIVAASPVLLPVVERISIGSGKVRTLNVMGVYPEYEQIRKLILSQGRFFDRQDCQEREKVGVITSKLAMQLYGSEEVALGKIIHVAGLPFTIIGTFRERVETFGQSEVSDTTMLVPSSVVPDLQTHPMVKQVFFSTANTSSVAPTTASVQHIIQSRHRPQAVYRVRNLTQLRVVATRAANALTSVLVGVSLIVLLVSGIGIMNIMLDSVRLRIHEIGIRKAVGAANRQIGLQFLTEATLISLIGGTLGMAVGFLIPLSVRCFSAYRFPVPGFSAVVGVVVSSVIGTLFGTVPAIRASRMNPVESLRCE